MIIFWVKTKLMRSQIQASVQFKIKPLLATECVKACFVCMSHHLEWKWPQSCSRHTFQTRSPFPAQFHWVWQECLELSGEQISKGQSVLTWRAVWLRWRHIFRFISEKHRCEYLGLISESFAFHSALIDVRLEGESAVQQSILRCRVNQIHLSDRT